MVLQEFNKNIVKSKYLNDKVTRTAKTPSSRVDVGSRTSCRRRKRK